MSEQTYGCDDSKPPPAEFVDESRREPRNARCALGGEYTFDNFCTIVKALNQKGHTWDMVFVVPIDASESAIRPSQYKGPGYGESLYVNPRQRGQVIVGEKHEEFEYCVDISPGRIRFVLIGLIMG